MHNELHVDKMTPLKWQYEGMNMPYVEIDIAKNKETSSKKIIPYKFITTKSRFIEVAGDEFDKLRKQMTIGVNDMMQTAREYNGGSNYNTGYNNKR